tara:strand:+ start:122 stop:2437 length:2316 start_codon:yes stop_codon:yes gene_type:complete
MAIYPLTRDFFENVSFTLAPEVHFISSSLGVTGSEYVAPIRSKCIKTIKLPEIPDGFNLLGSELDASNSNKEYDISDFLYIQLFQQLNSIAQLAHLGHPNFQNFNLKDIAERYLTAVDDAPFDPRKSKFFDVFRFEPGPQFTINTSEKNAITNVLMRHYKTEIQNSKFAYTNYNCLNFFTGSNVPSNTALIYPNIENDQTPKKDLSVQFWINPRYSNDKEDSVFNAGSILHMSSSFCLSLHSSSIKSKTGLIEKYKIVAQLSQSADIPPHKINFRTSLFPNDLIFSSSFELKKDHWHHVTFRWSPKYQNSSGSLIIDNNETFFHIPSESITTKNHGMVIGNFYQGSDSNFKKFFNQTISTKEGIAKLDNGNADPSPANYSFQNLLNAELSEIKLYDKYIDNTELLQTGSGVYNYNNLLFYLPPYFYPEFGQRETFETPFQKITTSSSTPFNSRYSFGVGGKEINLENFLRDYAKKRNPRILNASGSIISAASNISAEEFFYSDPKLIRRNLLIMPNDNGQLIPDYFVLKDQLTGSLSGSFNDINKSFDAINYSEISLRDQIPESEIKTNFYSEGSFYESVTNLTLLQRTRDTSSNEIAIFDISNLFYGNRIKRGSFELIDTNLTGSNNKISIKIKDNSYGSLYRADSKTKIATWNSIGNIFYDEGIVLIKSPHLDKICKDRTEIKMKGEMNMHSMVINAPCMKGFLNSSSNPSFVSLPKSENENDKNNKSFRISSINIHDSSFNIIMRANFSQPILKEEAEEFIIRLKQDF